MLQSFMKKPNSMDLRLPQRYNDPYGWTTGGCGGEWKTYTILLGKNNKVVTYMGMLQCPIEKPKIFQSGSKALSKKIFAVNEFVMHRVDVPEKEGLFVIIKPSSTCVFGNLVETMNEMHINKVRSFIVDDKLNKEEQKLLDENNL